MMKIAFWGYGKYGRRMFESLTSFCNDEFEIVRVYDRAFRKLKNTAGEKALPIHDPEDLLQDYKKGLFEKVFVCMLYVSEETKQFLRKHSIPELCLGGPDDLFPLSAFEQGKKPFQIEHCLFRATAALSDLEHSYHTQISESFLYSFTHDIITANR